APQRLRLPSALRVSIPLSVFMAGILFLMIASWRLERRDHQRTIESVKDNAKARAEHLGMAMAARGVEGPEHVERIVAGAGKDPAVIWAAVCSPDGTVVYASRAEWKERPLASILPLVVDGAVQRAMADSQPQFAMIGEDYVVAVNPVLREKFDTKPATATLIALDLVKPLSTQWNNAVADTLHAAVLLVICCMLLWVALHWFIQQRLRSLLEVANALNAGTKVAPLSGGDEFAEISRKLVDGQSRFLELASAIDDVFYMVSADKKTLLYVNPAYQKLWGRSIAGFRADPLDWIQAVPKDEREELMHFFDKPSTIMTHAKKEFRIFLPDDTMRWIESRVYPSFDEHGQVTRISVLASDISERRRLQTELLNVAERERQRIGYDLHDDLCQSLAAIKLRCEALTMVLKRGELPDPAKAEYITAHMAKATAQCRAIARGLSPVDIPGEGLAVALEKLVYSTELVHEVACFFHAPEPVIVANTNTAIHLYRITQEFLNNAVRHGKPERIDVRLENAAGLVRIQVTNDGQPYQEPAQQSQGMGLKILHYRAGAIGATVHVQSRSDGIPGTHAECLAPVSQ
ncbi:MAG: PAS domain-containing protein, partial [Roseimicrobium sp.]